MTLSPRRVRDQISKIVATKGFQRAPRLREFLRFINRRYYDAPTRF